MSSVVWFNFTLGFAAQTRLRLTILPQLPKSRDNTWHHTQRASLFIFIYLLHVFCVCRHVYMEDRGQVSSSVALHTLKRKSLIEHTVCWWGQHQFDWLARKPPDLCISASPALGMQECTATLTIVCGCWDSSSASCLLCKPFTNRTNSSALFSLSLSSLSFSLWVCGGGT